MIFMQGYPIHNFNACDSLLFRYFISYSIRFEETNEGSTPCKRENGEKCIGGYARAVTVIKELLELRRETNPLYLNAGYRK